MHPPCLGLPLRLHPCACASLQAVLVVAGIQVMVCLLGVFSVVRIVNEVRQVIEQHPLC